jgi:hypothetical protein
MKKCNSGRKMRGGKAGALAEYNQYQYRSMSTIIISKKIVLKLLIAHQTPPCAYLDAKPCRWSSLSAVFMLRVQEGRSILAICRKIDGTIESLPHFNG